MERNYATVTRCMWLVLCNATVSGRLSLRLSVCLSHLSTSAAASGGFAAVGREDRKYRSIATRPVLSCKCGQCHVVS